MPMKLIPYDTENEPVKPDHDRATDGFSITRLEGLIADREIEAPWRTTADKCCAYYDDDQSTAEKDAKAIQEGIEPRNSNLIKPVINGVLGEEAKARRDPKLEPDDDETADVADVMSLRLKEAQRETNADMAISNAYASQVKAGFGCVEVSRASDPLGYQYRVEDIHRNSVWWDRRCKSIDISLYARWFARGEWRDLDEIMAAYPEHKETLENAADGWSTCMTAFSSGGFMDESLAAAMEVDSNFSVSRSSWLDGVRRRIRMYEIWYRMPAEVVTMRVNGKWVEWDEANPAHVQAAARGLVKLRKGVTMQVRKAIYAGPFRLTDEGTKRRRFPYIPFIAFRSDKDGSPYGMVHSMLAPQDDFNERYMRIQWMLKAQQLIVDDDALAKEHNNIADITRTMRKPNMVAVLNKDRRHPDGLKFVNTMSLEPQQYDMMNHAEAMIQKTAGRYSAQLGDAPTGVTSGRAINSLVEQGMIAMGELNDNYAFARRLVYESLLDLIIEDHLERDMQVILGAGQTRRTVVLNTIDPQTNQPLNVVKDAAVRVGLSEVPASAAYQMQMSQNIGEMIRNLAGSPAVSLLLPTYVEANTAFGPNRKQVADDIRRQAGLPTGGDRQAVQQWEAQQQEMAAKTAALQEQAAQVELASKQAAAMLDNAKVLLTQAQTLKTAAEAEAIANEPDEDEVINQVFMAADKAHQERAAA